MNTPQPAPSQRTPLGESFASSRKIGLAALGMFAIFGTGWYFLTHDGRPQPKATAVPPPPMAAPAGGNNHSEILDQTAQKQEEEESRRARQTNGSYASALATNSAFTDDHAPALAALPGAASQPANRPGGEPGSRPKAESKAAKDDGSNPFTRDPPGSTPPANAAGTRDRRVSAASLSDTAEAELFAAWSGRPPSLSVRIAAQPSTKDGKATAQGNGFSRAPEGSQTAAATVTAPSDERPGAEKAQAKRKLLLAAGRGVYGHAVLTANSDIGGQALVEIDSGPLIHDRVSGAFQRKDELLVITFNRLMIGDADPIAISAYAVSPDTAETGVASDVDEHIATRIILPTAAAFVEGLGNAMQSTNTTSYTSGLGLSSFTNLTLPQQMGVAAGKAGQQLGQILQQQTPQQATVWLKKDSPVGVIFSEPVYAP